MIGKILGWFLGLLAPAATALAFFEGGAPGGGAPGATGAPGGTGDLGGTSGAPPAGSGAPPVGGAPAGTGAPPAPPAPQAGGGETEAALRKEIDRLRNAERKREEDAARARGDFEKLANDRAAENAALTSRMEAVARRSHFAESAAGKVQDVAAAWKLAVADGLVGDWKVDEAGTVAGDVPKLIAKLTETYPFLKPGTGAGTIPGGTGNGAAGAGPTFDASKASSEQLIRHGLEERYARMGRQGGAG
jgi:hypothetical protein